MVPLLYFKQWIRDPFYIDNILYRERGTSYIQTSVCMMWILCYLDTHIAIAHLSKSPFEIRFKNFANHVVKHFRTKTSSPNLMFSKKSDPNLPIFVISTLKKEHDFLLKWSQYCKMFQNHMHTPFFETLEKQPCKQKTVSAEEWLST